MSECKGADLADYLHRLSCTDNGYCGSHPGVAAWTDLAWYVPSEVIFKSDVSLLFLQCLSNSGLLRTT